VVKEYRPSRRVVTPRLVKVEHTAIKVCQHVVLEDLLLTVQRKLFAAHGAHLPVALHMLLKLALVVVGWEDDLTEGTALHVHTTFGAGRGEILR